MVIQAGVVEVIEAGSVVVIIMRAPVIFLIIVVVMAIDIIEVSEVERAMVVVVVVVMIMVLEVIKMKKKKCPPIIKIDEEEIINISRITEIDLLGDRAIPTKCATEAIADFNIRHQMDYLLLIRVIQSNHSNHRQFNYHAKTGLKTLL